MRPLFSAALWGGGDPDPTLDPFTVPLSSLEPRLPTIAGMRADKMI